MQPGMPLAKSTRMTAMNSGKVDAARVLVEVLGLALAAKRCLTTSLKKGPTVR